MNKEDLDKLHELECDLGDAATSAYETFIHKTGSILEDKGREVHIDKLEVMYSNAAKILLAMFVLQVKDLKAQVEDAADKNMAEDTVTTVMVEVIDVLHHKMLPDFLGKEQTIKIMETLSKLALSRMEESYRKEKPKSPIDLSGSKSFTAVLDELKRKAH